MRQPLNFEELRDPPSWHWPGYFWMLNDRLDADTIVQQLEDMARCGARSVCPHPMPHEFRPTSMNTRLEPEYLSEEYFRLVRQASPETQRLLAAQKAGEELMIEVPAAEPAEASPAEEAPPVIYHVK